MKQYAIIFLLISLLAACNHEQRAKEQIVLKRLVQEYTTHPNWNVRKEKRRQLINQGPVAISHLWDACDTDYFEELHQALALLQDMRVYSQEEWELKRSTILKEAKKKLAQTHPSETKRLLNQLSLIGDTQDIDAALNYLQSPDQEIRELALATIYRLGFPYQENKTPRDVFDIASQWSQQERTKQNRESRLWEALKKAHDPVYRQIVVQGLIHSAVSNPVARARRVTFVWDQAFQETNPHIRVDFVLLLGVLGDERVQNFLIDAHWLTSDDPNLRIATSWSLNQLGFDNPQPK